MHTLFTVGQSPMGLQVSSSSEGREFKTNKSIPPGDKTHVSS